MRLFTLLVTVALFSACEPAPAVVCHGYAITDTGSGCRDVTTGEYAPRHKCSECTDTKVGAP